MVKFAKSFLESLIIISILAMGNLASAQDSADLTRMKTEDDLWNGEWIAEGTFFRIGVSVQDNIIKVTQIESMGQLWTNQDGEVDGHTARVKVDYAGASGVIQAELVDADTAVAFAVSCTPDFMLVCVLSKGRQAIFRRVSD